MLHSKAMKEENERYVFRYIRKIFKDFSEDYMRLCHGG